jgi:hypothetical protein
MRHLGRWACCSQPHPRSRESTSCRLDPCWPLFQVQRVRLLAIPRNLSASASCSEDICICMLSGGIIKAGHPSELPITFQAAILHCAYLHAVSLLLQVLEWTQTIILAGEAFCGSESATLRDALKRHSGRFFAAYHSANLQVWPKQGQKLFFISAPWLAGGDALPSCWPCSVWWRISFARRRGAALCGLLMNCSFCQQLQLEANASGLCCRQIYTRRVIEHRTCNLLP